MKLIKKIALTFMTTLFIGAVTTTSYADNLFTFNEEIDNNKLGQQSLIETNPVSSALENTIVNGLKNEQYTIDISSFRVSQNDIFSLYTSILSSHGELYFAEGGLQWYYDWNGYVTKIIPKYVNVDKNKINAETKKVMSKIKPGMSDAEKVLAVHDYLAIDIEYANKEYLNGNVPAACYTVQGAIIDKYAVCQGYAEAFSYYMYLLGIPCNVVEGGNHAWNQVYINNNWYFVDVTWDDPVYDMYGRVTHNYFLKSSYNFPGHYWDSSKYKACTSTKYDYLLCNDVDTEMIYHNGYWYYIGPDKNLYKYNLNSNSKARLTTIGGTWYSWNSSSFYTCNYARITSNGSKLFYSQPNAVYCCDFSGKNKKKLFNVDTSNGYLYGIKLVGNTMYLEKMKTPNSQFRVITKKTISTKDPKTDISKKSMKLTSTLTYYTGKPIKPGVKVTGLTRNKDYKVSYSSNTNIGIAKVKVTGIGSYKGSKTLTFKILPKAPTLYAPKSAKKKIMTVKWSKANCTGYEVFYSTNSSFRGYQKKVLTSSKTLKTDIKSLTSGKVYYTKVRAYKTVKGIKYYGKFSSVKRVKIK